MRRLAVLAVVLLAACSSGGGSRSAGAFPGDARAKAAELVRQAHEAGVRVADVATVAGVYGTDGGSACRFKTAVQRRQAEDLAGSLPSSVMDPRFPTMVLAVYCPWLI